MAAETTAAGKVSFDREHGMASKKTLNAKNLEALGAARLAELLLELSAGDAAAKRRLRLELAGTASAGEVAREVRNRLASMARARSFIDWQKRKAFVDDLETQRRAIIEKVAPSDPAEALELMWRFLGLASPVFGRCDDSSGTVGDVFRTACRDLGDLAATANPRSEELAERVSAALTENDYGQYDELIRILAPALGPEGSSDSRAASSNYRLAVRSTVTGFQAARQASVTGAPHRETEQSCRGRSLIGGSCHNGERTIRALGRGHRGGWADGSVLCLPVRPRAAPGGQRFPRGQVRRPLPAQGERDGLRKQHGRLAGRRRDRPDLPSGRLFPGCFTIINYYSEGKALWEAKVTDWHDRHPEVGFHRKPADPGAYAWPRYQP